MTQIAIHLGVNERNADPVVVEYLAASEAKLREPFKQGKVRPLAEHVALPVRLLRDAGAPHQRHEPRGVDRLLVQIFHQVSLFLCHQTYIQESEKKAFSSS